VQERTEKETMMMQQNQGGGAPLLSDAERVRAAEVCAQWQLVVTEEMLSEVPLGRAPDPGRMVAFLGTYLPQIARMDITDAWLVVRYVWELAVERALARREREQGR
jgi:hypothetical protein